MKDHLPHRVGRVAIPRDSQGNVAPKICPHYLSCSAIIAQNLVSHQHLAASKLALVVTCEGVSKRCNACLAPQDFKEKFQKLFLVVALLLLQSDHSALRFPGRACLAIVMASAPGVEGFWDCLGSLRKSATRVTMA